LQYDEDGNPVVPHSEAKTNPINWKLYKETFTTHNFMWTQWKKLKHFPHLKPPTNDSSEETAKTNLSNRLKMYSKLENNFHLSNKYALFYNMRRYYKAHDRDPFEVLPVTFHIKAGVRDAQFFSFLDYFNNILNSVRRAAKKEIKLKAQIESIQKDMQLASQSALFSSFNQTSKDEEIAAKQKEELKTLKAKLVKCEIKQQIKNIWIVKPGENTNRGTGITVESDLSEITRLIGSGDSANRTYILQKYIESPALYKNRKFDIRCFAMITSVNGHLKGYNYLDCYIRTSGKEFSLNSFNKFIHLTNDAVQKKAEEYGKHEFGNKVSVAEYQQYLNQTEPKLNINF
jgi:hypothetical protein